MGRCEMSDLFEIPNENRRSFTMACPMCCCERKKKSARSLSVYRDDDGWLRYMCHHPGCEWNAWQKRKDDFPRPYEKETAQPPRIIMPIPHSENIPVDYLGDALYWYRDKEGRYQFANRRIQFGNEKVYVPFVYTNEGFITGKKAKWPDDYRGLFGAETLKDKTRVIIVEGEKAALAARERFKSFGVVSWLGGANRGYDKVDWSSLRGVNQAILWPDNDEPGKEVMEKIAKLLPCRKILIANVDHLPPKHDLADEIEDADISKAFRESKVIPNHIQGVLSVSEIEDQIKESSKFRKTGFDVFDAHTKLPGSGLLVMEGRTKHFKTSATIALTANMLERELESKVLFYSYEMKASKVFLKYIKSFDPKASEDDYAKSPAFEKVKGWIENGSLQIVDQASQLTIKDIVIAANKEEMSGGVIVIDYVQIVPMGGAFNRNSRQVMIKELLDELRVAAHKNNVLAIVISQLTPDYTNPHNDSPREAKDIHFSADLVLRVWNRSVGESHPTYNNYVKNCVLHTYLNREGESNVIFECDMKEGATLDIKRRVKK